MEQAPEWNKEALLQSPLFAPLHPVIARIEEGDFPTLQDCNAQLASRDPPITVQNGMTLHFVPQEPGKLEFSAQYEPRCYLAGEVQMRSRNWHDLFNALVWLSFPKTKAALNARHYHALMEERANGYTVRGMLRDVNTLLDESGVIVVYADAALAAQLRDYQWKELFWHRREQVRDGMGFYLIGHGLYEKALEPYVGMTGHGLLLPVEQWFFSLTLELRLAHLDSLLGARLSMPEQYCSTRELSPLPLLGIPGWAADNDCAAYYDNTVYFRPGRRRKEVSGRDRYLQQHNDQD